jgi:hypothetical protein
MKKIGSAMLILILSAARLVADLPPELSGLFASADSAQLARTGELTSTFKENGAPRFLPHLAQAEEVRQGVANLKPMFGVEVCFVHKAVRKTDGETERRGIFRTLSAISTLKGLEYYSVSRKRMRELFIEAYRVSAPEKRDRQPDLVEDGPVPAYRLIHTFQNDSTFGENFFSVAYRSAGGAFSMTMQNTNKIWYGIIPLIDPGNLVYYIIVYPAGDYLLFYSLVCVNGANPFGIMESKTESFYNRIKALDGWFGKQSGLF